MIVIAVLTLALAIIIPSLAAATTRARDAANLTHCAANLGKIGIALQAYAADNSGNFPIADTLVNPHPELLTTLLPHYLPDPKLFYCPAQEKPTLALSEANLTAANIGYFYYIAENPPTDDHLSKFLRTDLDWPRILTARSDPNSWLLSDAWFSGDPTAHASYKTGINFLTLNGSVQFLSESPRHEFH